MKSRNLFVIIYNNEHPEDLGISGSLASMPTMPTRVLERMFG
jgi:hypothetical protein